MSKKNNGTPINSRSKGNGKVFDVNPDEGYTATSHAKNEVNQVAQQASGIIEAQKAINNNENASAGEKSVATALNVAEGGLQAFGVVTSLTTKVSESLLMPVMQKLAVFKGQAILPVSKQMDPVFGIDVHMVTIPPSPAPIPMPHFYAGMMFRLADFASCIMLELIPVPAEAPTVEEGSSMGEANKGKAANLAYTVATMVTSMLGASVKVGMFPRTVAGTPSKMIPHIPMGVGFHPGYSAMVAKNNGHALLGSLFVVADSSPLTGTPPHMHNDCWDVGVFSIHNTKPNRNADKKPIFPAHLYVPSGAIIPIPMAKQVITNMIPAPINPLTIGSRLFRAGLGKLKRKNEKLIKKLADKSKANGKNPNLKCKFFTFVSKHLGTGTSHPADVASGTFYTDNIDFSLSGIIPLEWERTYYSQSEYDGPLGIGWHHTYDMALDLQSDDGYITLRLQDGRLTLFDKIDVGESSFNRQEKLTLYRDDVHSYYITDLDGLIYRFTEKTYSNPHNKTTANLLQSISNRNGYSIRIKYDNDGIINRIIDTAGRTIRFETEGKGHISAIHLPKPENPDEYFVASSYEYDSHRRLIAQTDALENTMRFEYKGTLLTKEIWRNGVEWNITYDKKTSESKCLEIEGTGGLFHHKLNYIAPDCTVVTNSLGEKTIYYHRYGLVTKRVDPNGGETVFRYNRYNELEWTTDPLGNLTGELHDDIGNVVSITAADGSKVALAYENSALPNLPTSATDAMGGKWTWEYDKQGNLAKRIDPLGTQTTFEYKDGLLSTIIGAQGAQTRLTYDGQGNMQTSISPDGGRNRWLYDYLGQCTTYTNAQDGKTCYTYNLLGNVIRITEPDGNQRELNYDTEGNITLAKDSQREVRFTYCGVNKLASRSEKGATLRFAYDTEDQLRAVINEAGEEYRFQLDAQGDVIEEIGFDGLRRRYRRDLAGQVTSVVRPNGKEITYQYDTLGRITKITYNPLVETTLKETPVRQFKLTPWKVFVKE